MNAPLDFPVASNASIPMEPTNACVQRAMKHSLITQTAANPSQVLPFDVFITHSCIQIICGKKPQPLGLCYLYTQDKNSYFESATFSI